VDLRENLFFGAILSVCAHDGKDRKKGPERGIRAAGHPTDETGGAGLRGRGPGARRRRRIGRSG